MVLGIKSKTFACQEGPLPPELQPSSATPPPPPMYLEENVSSLGVGYQAINVIWIKIDSFIV